MAENNIAGNWTIADFKEAHGKIKITKDFTNSDTGEIFKSVAFVDPANVVTLVNFSSKLGIDTGKKTQQELADFIKTNKSDLQIVRLADTGNYKLCRKGQDSWLEVEI